MATSDTMVDENKSEKFIPLSYQTEIMEQAKSKNLIVCLPTGSGKTFIAIMLIKELSPSIRLSLKDGGKRTILLVKTVELARQHYDTMNAHLEGSNNPDLKIKIYCGSSKINVEDSNRWNNEFETYHILIFTVQIFLNLLSHNRFSLDKVNLLIFDECHHATGNDSYAVIMKEHYKSCQYPPRILGLTASISGQKIDPGQLHKAGKELENIFQARIETGSDRMEINRSSTSVNVKYQCCSNYEQKISRKSKPVINIFKEIKLLYDELCKYLKVKNTKNEVDNNPSKINAPSDFIQLQCRTLDQLKSHLDNITHIGYDLGLYGLSLGIKSLRDYIKSTNVSLTIINPTEKDLFDKIIEKLDGLIELNLQNLIDNPEILYSDKVIQLKKYIEQNKDGQSIVFVERVYTAAFLCQVLSKLFQDSIKIKYLAGSKAYIDGISVSAKYQREVVKEFRDKFINVLISTAIIEEGLDVPGCNLVIRFNKPQNFSSYMQSKGRARAKTGNVLFVILNDEKELEEYSKNKEEYTNYETMEKMLKRNFKTYCYDDTTSDDDVDSLEPYRPMTGVKISGMRAVQIIYKYCTILGNGQILSPRFCFDITESNKFQCTLSMPINCPIREDVMCENKNKKVAKRECCLKMVEKLHKIGGELDKSCLPIRPERCATTIESSDDEETEKVSIEIIDKQIAYFPRERISLSPSWHLYRINVSNNNDLGFIVPSEINKLPIFQLNGRDSKLTVEVIYLKPIDYKEFESQLKDFCRYIFEDVFDNMITGSEAILKFDIENSPLKLFPCLLKQSGDIDYQRMALICNRKNKKIQNPSELNDQEVYMRLHSPDKQFYMNISDDSLLKRASDLWEHKRPAETIESYADYFEYKISNIRIQRDYLMGTMKNFRKPRINYLNNSPSKKEKESNTSATKYEYFPIELLCYAPLNQKDFELIYKLPSILNRISHLDYIEQLRQLLADNIRSYSLLSVDQMPIVTFGDCLPNIFSSSQSTVLPLVSLNYNLLSANNCEFQPSPDLLFQSITRRSANEDTDMENLEILGDCFLKLAMSMSLYHKYPSDGAGKLTSKKDKQVSNENLYQLAMKKELKNYLYFTRLNFGGPEANWLPPGFIVDEVNAERYTKQKAKRKAFADMIEALIGAFLISTNYLTTIQFMNWLGLDVIPTDQHDQLMKTPSVLHPGLCDTMDEVTIKILELCLHRGFAEIEKQINYNFKNKAYLVAAFTHPSYYNNRLTQCYERLEYLGDAVLDFLVVRCIFVEHYKQVTPSRVTDIRQDLSNNGRLAYILVSCDLDKKILHVSPYLFNQITVYLRDETRFPAKTQSIQEKLSNDIDQWADSTAPKALADVFEALVGAIFLDSGYSLETVWKVIEPFLRQYINRSVTHPILNPVRAFFERQGKITNETKDSNGNFICHVQLPNGPEVQGYGKNKKLAKHDACKKAFNTS